MSSEKTLFYTQVDNYVQLFHMEDDKHHTMAQPINEDFQKLTRKPPMTAKEWCERNAALFK